MGKTYLEEYKGKSAKRYGHHPAKWLVLFPALDRVIPKAKAGQSLLDVGCGIGDYSENVLQKGYEYKGFDVSKDMVLQARKNYPELDFKVADARKFSSLYKKEFDIVLLNMVLLVMNRRSDLKKVLSECRKVKKDRGRVIIGNAHPACDPYMQKHYFSRKDVITDFQGYFKSGAPFTVHKKLGKGNFDFNDYHWTLRDYVDAINQSGLRIVGIDECEPSKELRHVDPEYYERKKYYPTFIVVVCE